MKSHNIAACLELIAKILREAPDAELLDTLRYIHKHLQGTKADEEEPKSSAIEASTLSQEMVDKIRGMSPADAERLLASSKEFSAVAQMRELAERLGVQASRRQSHAALVNLVVRYIESRQMDAIIRSGKATTSEPGKG